MSGGPASVLGAVHDTSGSFTVLDGVFILRAITGINFGNINNIKFWRVDVSRPDARADGGSGSKLPEDMNLQGGVHFVSSANAIEWTSGAT